MVLKPKEMTPGLNAPLRAIGDPAAKLCANSWPFYGHIYHWGLGIGGGIGGHGAGRQRAD